VRASSLLSQLGEGNIDVQRCFELVCGTTQTTRMVLTFDDVDLERFFIDRVPVANMDYTAFGIRWSLPRDGANAGMHPQHPGNVGIEVVDRIGPGDVIAQRGSGLALQVCQVDVVEEALCSADSKSLFLGRVGWASLLDLCFRAR
jgi:hypothetical protein